MTPHSSWYGCPLGRIQPMLPRETSRLKVGVRHCQSFRLHRPTAFFTSAHALSKSAAAHTAEEHVRKLEPSGAFSCSKMKTAQVENETSRMPSDVRLLWKDEKADGAVDWSRTACLPRYVPIFISSSWFSAPLVLTLLWNRDKISGETNCCIFRVKSKDILVQSEHFFREDGTSICRTYCPLVRNTMTWPFQSSKIVKDFHGAEEYVSRSQTRYTNLDIHCCSTLAYFQRQLRSFGVSNKHYHAGQNGY